MRIAIVRLSVWTLVLSLGGMIAVSASGAPSTSSKENILAGFSALKIASVSRPMGEDSVGEAIKKAKIFRAARVDTLGKLAVWLRKHPKDLPATAILERPLPKAKLLAQLPQQPLPGKKETIVKGKDSFGIPRNVTVQWLTCQGLAFAMDNDQNCIAIRITALSALGGKAAPPTPNGTRLWQWLKTEVGFSARFKTTRRFGVWPGPDLVAHLKKSVSEKTVRERFGRPAKERKAVFESAMWFALAEVGAVPPYVPGDRVLTYGMIELLVSDGKVIRAARFATDRAQQSKDKTEPAAPRADSPKASTAAGDRSRRLPGRPLDLSAPFNCPLGRLANIEFPEKVKRRYARKTVFRMVSGERKSKTEWDRETFSKSKTHNPIWLVFDAGKTIGVGVAVHDWSYTINVGSKELESLGADITEGPSAVAGHDVMFRHKGNRGYRRLLFFVPAVADEVVLTYRPKSGKPAEVRFRMPKAVGKPKTIEKPKTVGMTLKLAKGVTMRLALIPAGKFLMGSGVSAKELARQYKDEPDATDLALASEHPQHQVTITKPFYMGVAEVTQAQWKAVMGTEPWKGKKYVKEDAANPASYVRWHEATTFCTKLSQKISRTIRLPTEAEWEYACRAGSKTKYCFGNDDSKLGDYAWHNKTAGGIGEEYAHAVGRKKPNAWGLYDMHGNVSEWCSDYFIYGRKYYPAKGNTVDPTGPTADLAMLHVLRGGGGEAEHVLRGACFFSKVWACRSACRGGAPASSRSHYTGFRVVLSPASRSSNLPSQATANSSKEKVQRRDLQAWQRSYPVFVAKLGEIIAAHAPTDAPRQDSSLVTFLAFHIGKDSSSAPMAWVLYHGTKLSRVYQEIDKAFGGRSIRWAGTVDQVEKGEQGPKVWVAVGGGKHGGWHYAKRFEVTVPKDSRDLGTAISKGRTVEVHGHIPRKPNVTEKNLLAGISLWYGVGDYAGKRNVMVNLKETTIASISLSSQGTPKAPAKPIPASKPAKVTLKAEKEAPPRKEVKITPKAEKEAPPKEKVHLRVLYYLAPSTPRHATYTLDFSGGRVGALAHVEVQKREPARKLLARFGKPDNVRKDQTRQFVLQTVKGEVWEYGPLSVMFQSGKAAYMWMQGDREKVEAPAPKPGGIGGIGGSPQNNK